ncbi:hypothetical protein [uncultured Aquimarina sp.]|uniref:hypothetical protein n=1 Tax=uncultured Aquimarina sp. TaxID=575652 RepID=UPI0026267A3A|nr:hypothetical protein [uncultured Aquimarina sp.]
MKKVINYWPYLLALLPQFIFTNYTLIVVTVILIGFISGYAAKNKLVVVKMIILELIVFSIVLFVYKDRIFYLDEIFKNLEIPIIMLSIVVPVFNALNITVLFFMGYTLSSLLPGKTLKLEV